jgi:hypothetical protein
VELLPPDGELMRSIAVMITDGKTKVPGEEPAPE